jgi:hypothetical protein
MSVAPDRCPNMLEWLSATMENGRQIGNQQWAHRYAPPLTIHRSLLAVVWLLANSSLTRFKGDEVGVICPSACEVQGARHAGHGRGG